MTDYLLVVPKGKRKSHKKIFGFRKLTFGERVKLAWYKLTHQDDKWRSLLLSTFWVEKSR